MSPLQTVGDAHLRVVCDACRASAEVCGRRDPPVMARVAAIRKFKSSGWHHDPGTLAPARSQDERERDGVGKWYCPACGHGGHR